MFNWTFTCRLTSHTGETKALSANSCKHIVDSFSGACAPEDGVYWVQDLQVNVSSNMHT